MPHTRLYTMWYDASLDRPSPNQLDDPYHQQYNLQNSSNVRTVFGSADTAQQFPYTVADGAVNPRGAKNIIWSSEGYTSSGNSYASGVAIPALTANQKKATGSVLSTSTGNIGTLLGATVPPLDLSPYKALVAVVNLVSFTGGSSPTIQFELDLQDDTATPVSFAVWKPTALSAAATAVVILGAGAPFAQAAAAPNTAATGFAAIAAPSGVTYYSIPFPLIPNANFQWTVANTPTAISWSAWLYGIN